MPGDPLQSFPESHVAVDTRNLYCRVSQGRQRNTSVRLNVLCRQADSATQSTGCSMAGHGFRPGICALCWPARPCLTRPRWQGQTVHKVASLRRPPQQKGLRPLIEGPCIGSSSHVDLGQPPSCSASNVLSISPMTDTSLPSSPLGQRNTTVRGLSCSGGSAGGES